MVVCRRLFIVISVVVLVGVVMVKFVFVVIFWGRGRCVIFVMGGGWFVRIWDVGDRDGVVGVGIFGVYIIGWDIGWFWLVEEFGIEFVVVVVGLVGWGGCGFGLVVNGFFCVGVVGGKRIVIIVVGLFFVVGWRCWIVVVY